MQLTETDIQEFKTLYEAELDEKIDWSEAECMADELVRLYETIWHHRLKTANAAQRENPSAHNDRPAI